MAPGVLAFLPVLFVLAFVALAVIAIVVARQMAERRRREFALEAQRLGLLFADRGGDDLWVLCRDFKLTQGGSPRCLNVLHGRHRGVDVRIFDHIFRVSTGKNSHDVTIGVAFASLARPWPHLSITPETFGHKLFDAFGGEDIDFESDEFSRRFWVRADDRKFAYDVITPRMMEFLMEPGWTHWRFQGSVACLWKRGRLGLHEIAPTLDRLVAFLEQVPDHVNGRLEAGPAAATPAW